MINLRKCTKCGQIKAFTEYYKHGGNTCKECMKKAQRIRNAQNKLATKESAEDNMEQRLCYNYTKANVWVSKVQVMSKGILVGQEGEDWWEEKKVRHEKWLRRKRMKEKAALPALSIEVPLEHNTPANTGGATRRGR